MLIFFFVVDLLLCFLHTPAVFKHLLKVFLNSSRNIFVLVCLYYDDCLSLSLFVMSFREAARVWPYQVFNYYLTGISFLFYFMK